MEYSRKNIKYLAKKLRHGIPKPKPKYKNGINIWPIRVMLLLIFIHWIFYYYEGVSFLVIPSITVFSILCVIGALFFLLILNIKKSIIFLLPVLLATLIGLSPVFLLPINKEHHELLLKVTTPVTTKFIHSRHYFEYLIQKNILTPEMANMVSGVKYKEWKIHENNMANYLIIFDVKDEVVNKHDSRARGRVYSVYKLGEHFYMLSSFYEPYVKEKNLF